MCCRDHLCVHKLIYISSLTNDHELWVTTERQYCKYKRAKVSLLSLGDTVKHSRGAQSGAGTPLHQEELAELLGRLVRLPPDASLRRHFRRVRVRADSGADVRLSLLAWEHLGISPEEEDEDRSVWVSRLRVLPPTSRTRISKNKKSTVSYFQ